MRKFSKRQQRPRPRPSAFDRALSPHELRAYIKYQLYLLELGIRDAQQGLEQQRDCTLAAWPKIGDPMAEDMLAGWSNLCYLLSSRDLLRRALNQLERE